MLILGSSFRVGDVTVFPDEDQPDLLYTAPESLRVVSTRNGAPSFALVYLGDGANLMLETEWQVDEEEREQILQQASAAYRSEHGAGPASPRRLLPVPIAGGTARLQLNEFDQAPALLGETVVSGYGSMRAAMSLQLSAATAVRVERALRVDDADVVASYDLEASAAADAAVRWDVNLDSVRRILTEARRGFGADDIIHLLTRLCEEGAVDVTERLLDESSSQGNQIRQSLAEMLSARLEGGAAGSSTLSQATRAPQKLRFTPSCSLSNVMRGLDPSSFVRNLDIDAG